MKYINSVPKDVQRILSSDKMSEKYNEQKVFFKKIVLNNFAIFTGKYLCWWYLFFKKNKKLTTKKAKKLIKKKTPTQVFSW